MTTGRLARLSLSATALLLSACAGTRVLVRDSDGKPVSGANVFGDSPSITIGPVLTDARGEARVPWSVQELWWVRAEADGYCPTSWNLDVRGRPHPVTIVLRPRAPGDERPCFVLPPGSDAKPFAP